MLKQIVVIGLLVASSSSWGEGATTFGNRDCSQWVADRTGHSQMWLMGFLSGLNTGMAANESNDVLGKIRSPGQATLWMDKFCRENPLMTVQEGAVRLYVELRKK